MVNLFNNRRARLFWFAATRPHKGVSLSNLFENIAGPTSDMFAGKLIDRLEQGEGFNRVFLKGRSDPLYFPTTMPAHTLNMVLGESRPWHWHYYEVAETPVTPEDVVLDCGAAEGFFSFSVSPRAKQVYAFEPLPEFAACLKLTFAGRPNVKVVPAGISNQIGTAYIKSAGTASEITSDPTPDCVVIDTIDHFCDCESVAPTYLKADVEGFERKLIAGAAKTIKKHKPRIAITTYHVKGDAEALASAILALNSSYKIKLKGLEHQRGEPMMLHAW